MMNAIETLKSLNVSGFEDVDAYLVYLSEQFEVPIADVREAYRVLGDECLLEELVDHVMILSEAYDEMYNSVENG